MGHWDTKLKRWVSDEEESEIAEAMRGGNSFGARLRAAHADKKLLSLEDDQTKQPDLAEPDLADNQTKQSSVTAKSGKFQAGDERRADRSLGGQKGGSVGGKKAASNMTPEERRNRARKAALSRYHGKGR